MLSCLKDIEVSQRCGDSCVEMYPITLHSQLFPKLEELGLLSEERDNICE